MIIFLYCPLPGLDDAIEPYIENFVLSGVDGRKLLMLTHSDLEKLSITKLGHQELVLEGVDLLRSLVSIRMSLL